MTHFVKGNVVKQHAVEVVVDSLRDDGGHLSVCFEDLPFLAETLLGAPHAEGRIETTQVRQ